MATIHFKEKLYQVDDWTILRLPKEESVKLPSRGIAMVEGTINGFAFKMPLEPDGRGSHWLHVDKKMLKEAKIASGDKVTVELKSSNDWPEPTIPPDVKKAIVYAKAEHKIWVDLTPIARWDWLRWINATKNEGTRANRIEVMLSKMRGGMRRPCCFNRSMCTEPHVSKNGVLQEPATKK